MPAPVQALSAVSTAVSSPSKYGAKPVKNPAKSNVDFREASRREDAQRLERAFSGPSQQAIAIQASRALGISPRQVIYWLHLEHDMPSWAVKAVHLYLGGLDRFARWIEGGQ